MTTFRPFLLSVLLPVAAVCQFAQSNPEYCGTGQAVITLPRDIQPAFEKQTASLSLRSGGPIIHFPLYDWRIDQICPLPDGRLVAFGFGGNGTIINILDPAKSEVVDALISYDPVLSPDGRWIVFRKYFPRWTDETPSDEYLLYDLKKSPLESRPSGHYIPESLDFNVGASIYPLGWKNESGDNIGAPTDQQHSSGKAFWTPDSTEIVFSDKSVTGRFIVIVSIDDNAATSALVHPVSESQPCARSDNALPARNAPWGDLARIDFGPRQASERILFVDFVTDGCMSETQLYRRSEFRPAPVEKRVREVPTRTPMRMPAPGIRIR